MIIGLDCAEPSLVLDKWLDELPTLAGLMERGTYGELTSVVPPITVPAWSCMMSSRTPGDLGIYGFRNRADHSYDAMYIANGAAVREPRLWDFVGRAGPSSIVLGVPGTYPPTPAERCARELLPDAFGSKPVHLPHAPSQGGRAGRGRVPVRLHELPDRGQGRPAPSSLRDDRPQVRARRPPTRDTPVGLLRDGRDGRRPHVSRLLEGDGSRASKARSREPAPGRDQGLPPSCRPAHGPVCSPTRTRRPSSSSSPITAASAWKAVSASTSGCVGRASRDARVEPTEVTTLEELGVDWSRTSAWGEGGYYSRVFLNVQGREPRGNRSRRRLRAHPRRPRPPAGGDPRRPRSCDANAGFQARRALPGGQRCSP